MTDRPFIKRQLMYDNEAVEVAVERTEVPSSNEGQFALLLVQQWGAVAAAPDGYDESRRQKMRLQTPAEVVDRACETSALMFAALRERGWMIDLPTIEEARATLRKADEAADEKAEKPKRER